MRNEKISQVIDDFSEYLKGVSEDNYKKLETLLRDLTLDKGNIKINVKNLNIITKVKALLRKTLTNREYIKKVNELQDVIDEIGNIQAKYFKDTFDAEEPKVIEEYQNQAFETVKESLLRSGTEVNVIQKTVDIVKRNINSGSSFADLNNELKTAMLGDSDTEPRLISYTKQVINDTLHGVARNYNNLMAEKLGLVWYEWAGGLVRHSRPLCIAMVDKHYFHKSEIPDIIKGNINGEKVSLQGLYPGTDKDNFVNVCGGYNCEHHATPVPDAVIPMNLREKFRT